ncbi:MAG: glutathione S-transferase family protein [Pseudomonadota bacterium]
MSELILHHYPPSPVTEKVRTAFGVKGLAWTSVVENRLPPRPELFAMNGGYRRVPVLQIGADIYCDSQIILQELERRFPEPSFFPGGYVGLPTAFSRFVDSELFGLAFRVAVAPVAAGLPPEFVADRARLYIGAGGDMERELKDLPHTLAQLRIAMGWFDARLGPDGVYLAGAAPGLVDLQVWWIYWFIRERWDGATDFFAEFPALNAWAARMDAIGHGEETSKTPLEALAIAKAATPDSPTHKDPRDPQGLKPGMSVKIAPLGDSGETPVAGVLRSVARDAIALTMTHPDCGETAVHFPRMGYRIEIA